MKAIVLGATGAIGKDLVQLLLDNDAITQVEILVRKAPTLTHNKLKVQVINFENTNEWTSLVYADMAFSCLGTTLKDAGSKEMQRKVDYDYQLAFAKAAAQNHVSSFTLVSAQGANAQSNVFYNRLKGELEDSVNALPFKHLYVFRPPILIRKNSNRWLENVAVKVFKVLNAVGLCKKLKPMHTLTVAKAMLNTALNHKNVKVIEAQSINNYV